MLDLFATKMSGIRTPPPLVAVSDALAEDSITASKASLGMVGGSVTYRSVAKLPETVNSDALSMLEKMLKKVLNEEVWEKRAWTCDAGVSRINYGTCRQIEIYCKALSVEAIDGIASVVESCIASTMERDELFAEMKRNCLASLSMFDVATKQVCNDACDEQTSHQHICPLADIKVSVERLSMDDVRNILPWLRPEMRFTTLLCP